MADREFEVEIPAHLAGKAADDAAEKAFADKIEKMTDDEVGNWLGL